MRELELEVGTTRVTAGVYGEPAGTAVALGHGAGGSRRSPFLVRIAEALAASGRLTLLYNFPYSEAGRKLPDRPERLEATCAAVGRHAQGELGAARLVHGGKSMGGRIASQAVAKGAPADALVFLGYPLHPPGRPEKLRDGHLAGVGVPMLFLQGTRDEFARWDLVQSAVERLGPGATLQPLEGADHSFRVRRGSGRGNAEVERELVTGLLAWLARAGL